MTHWTHPHGTGEAAAILASRRDHASLSDSLDRRVEALLVAVETAPADIPEARRQVVAFCERELLPHALAEERSIYPVAATDGRTRLLIEAMTAEHRTIAELVEVVRYAVHPVRAAAAAEGVRVLFETHVAKEDSIVYPLVAAAPGLSLETLLAGMHEMLGSDDHAPQPPASA
jgi:iron-sulfur cluster repair protein YtfE (RIC family)